MTSWRDISNRCRDIPLVDVLESLSCEQDSRDRQKWHTSNGPVWLGKGENSQRFFDHLTGVGGGGAIDMVMHIKRCEFKQAVEMLASMLAGTYARPSPPAVAALRQVSPIAAFAPPAQAVKHLAKVEDYLTGKRGLPQELVIQCIGAGSIYADERRNAVFLCVDEAGKATGAELRGTGNTAFKGMAPGSQRGTGFFMLKHSSPIHLVIVESAIDALSYRALFAGEASFIVSTAGVMPACPAIVLLAQTLGVTDITVAYDDDLAGNEVADKLMAQLSCENIFTLRRRTPWAKDWNEALQQRDGHLFEEAA